MRQAVAVLTILMLIGSAVPARAVSTPVINAATYGVELCAQSMCGAAIFAGVLKGQVGSNLNATGLFAVAVTHDPLPDPFQSAAITGGVFQFQIGFRTIKGVVLGGTLFNNGDNTFTVHALLGITSGGSGTVTYTGLLNHNVFPPTVIGTLTQ